MGLREDWEILENLPKGEEPGGENYWEGVRCRVFAREQERVKANLVPADEIRFKHAFAGEEGNIYGLAADGRLYVQWYEPKTEEREGVWCWKPLSMKLQSKPKETQP